MKVRASERDVSITYKSLSECSRSSTKSKLKTAGEREQSLLASSACINFDFVETAEFTCENTASIATSTQLSILNNLVSVISSNARDPALGLCEIPLYARDDTTDAKLQTLNTKH